MDAVVIILEVDFGLADGDELAIRDYFNMDVDLTSMASLWSEADAHYRRVSQHIQGARMLRQDPVECLFEFICSSNNHINRIGSMVEHLCTAYGTLIPLAGAARPLEIESASCKLNNFSNPKLSIGRGYGP
jgi:N-glycosylase/DNA lyase